YFFDQRMEHYTTLPQAVKGMVMCGDVSRCVSLDSSICPSEGMTGVGMINSLCPHPLGIVVHCTFSV
ncbi:MAG: hypothetical protein WC295_11425, partial [Methanoregula sp.]